MEYHEIGEKFEYKGNILEVVGGDGSSETDCVNCALVGNSPCLRNFCTPCNRKDERKQLREKFDEMTNHLAKISNVQHAGQVNMDFINELLEAKKQYRKSMDKWKDIRALSISTGIPVSLTALGAFALNGNPFSIAKIAGSLAIGAICSYADFYRAKKNRDPSYSSYLIGIDKLCRNVTRQSYTRLDEFIND